MGFGRGTTGTTCLWLWGGSGANHNLDSYLSTLGIFIEFYGYFRWFDFFRYLCDLESHICAKDYLSSTRDVLCFIKCHPIHPSFPEESGTGEPIVNVAKLRGARRRRRSPSPGSPRPKSQGTASRAQTARRAVGSRGMSGGKTKVSVFFGWNDVKFDVKRCFFNKWTGLISISPEHCF